MGGSLKRSAPPEPCEGLGWPDSVNQSLLGHSPAISKAFGLEAATLSKPKQ
jgi:hypothetical protein